MGSMAVQRQTVRCVLVLCAVLIVVAVELHFSHFSRRYSRGCERLLSGHVENDDSVKAFPGVLARLASGFLCGNSVTADDTVLSPNLVVAKITDPTVVSSLGWWMPHTRWTSSDLCVTSTGLEERFVETERRCPPPASGDESRSGCDGVAPAVNLAEEMEMEDTVEYRYNRDDQMTTCSLSLGIMCKPDHIRATFQYISLSRDIQDSDRYLISLHASAIHISTQPGELQLLGLLAIALHSDGSNTTRRLQVSNGTYAYTRFEASMVLVHQKPVAAFVLMLGCNGASGYIQFRDISIQAAIGHTKLSRLKALQRWHQFGLLDPCPPLLAAFRPSPQSSSNLAQWELYKPSTNIETGLLTLATQVSLDRIDVLERSMEHWNGPMSIALYVPSKSQLPEVDHEWKKLYVKKKLQSPKFQTMCSVVVVFAESVHDEYPINVLRNIAIRHSPTDKLLLLDADFIPSPDFHNAYLHSSLQWFNSSEYRSGLVQNAINQTAFVIPAFEYTTAPKVKVTVPRSKVELVEEVQHSKATIAPFRQLMSPLSHRPVDYQRWYSADQPYLITSYQDKFEPYIVLRKTGSMPVYDESFHRYGMNKVSHIMELTAAGYQFVVLPKVWAIHISHRESEHARKFLQDPHERLRNRLTRFQFVLSLQRRYGLGRCYPGTKIA